MKNAFDVFERDRISAAIASRKFDEIPEEFWAELEKELKPKKRGAPKLDEPRYKQRNIDICRKSKELREKGMKRKKIINELVEIFKTGEDAIIKVLSQRDKYSIDYVMEFVNTRYTSIVINRVYNNNVNETTSGVLIRAIAYGLSCLGVFYEPVDVENIIKEDIDFSDYNDMTSDELIYKIVSELPQSDIVKIK